jgi:cytochrome c-type biogenesis protein CcmH
MALRGILMGALLASSATAGAIVFEQRDFDNPEQLARYKTLTNELRCLVCQNQNIADSNADLAADLRREVHRMILEGKSDADVIDFMVTRYGDFVLYRPPLKAKTVLLWGAPLLLGVGGLVLLMLQLRARRRTASASMPLNEDEQARLDALLEKEEP